MALNVLINIFAKSPPAILIALSFVLLFLGFTASIESMISAGWTFFAFGVILQVIWLFIMARR